MSGPLPRLKLGGFHLIHTQAFEAQGELKLRCFHPKTIVTPEFDARILAHGTPMLAHNLFGAQGLDYVDAGGAGRGQH